jgi:acetyl esterase/lipase
MVMIVGCASQPRAATSAHKVMTDLAHIVDPQLRAALVSMPEIEVTLAAIRQDRQQLDDFLATMPRSERATNRTIPGSSGSPPVRVRIYRPATAEATLPALVWLHGGGWTLGRPEMDETFLQRLADDVPLVVISVDYRLAPEHPYPAPLDDAEATLDWTTAAAAELGLDPAQIFVGGTSSGANLAAGLAVRRRDRGSGPAVAFQLLLYPVLDDRLATPSMHGIADRRTITREFMRHRWNAYLGKGDVAADASPARATDLARLPPAALLVAELDPLRDEAVAYATRLWSSGVGCDLHVFRGGIHGFDVIAPTSSLSKLATDFAISSLRRARR